MALTKSQPPQWVACNFHTGAMIADLPGLVVDSVAATLSNTETTSATIPVASIAVSWDLATLPFGAACVLLDQVAGTDTWVPTWSGVITNRQRSASGGVLTLSLSTVEGYFGRVYVENETYTAVGQCNIVKALVEKYISPRIPLRVVVAGNAAGVVRTKTYAVSDMKTVGDVLNDLLSEEHPIEFTVTTEQISSSAFGWVLTIGEQDALSIGTEVATGLAPLAVFDYPGCLVDAQLSEDWSAGKGANYVRCLAPSGSSSPPAPPPQSAVYHPTYATGETVPDRPDVMFKFGAQDTLDITIDSMSQLNGIASAAVTVIGKGTNIVTLTQRFGVGPQFGVDWDIGDVVGLDISGQMFPVALVIDERIKGYVRTLGTEPSIEINIAGDQIDTYVQKPHPAPKPKPPPVYHPPKPIVVTKDIDLTIEPVIVDLTGVGDAQQLTVTLITHT